VLWYPAGAMWMAAGFAAVGVAGVAWLAGVGALGAYWDEVWRWGRLYAGSTFVEAPVRNGAVRTLNWMGFHAGIVLAASRSLLEFRHDHFLTVVAQKSRVDSTQVTEPRASASGACDEVRLLRERKQAWIGWLAVSLAGVALGLRFFPRYYFQLLPVVTMLAARGFAQAPRIPRAALLALLLIPIVRFAPSYRAAATDPTWRDIRMDQESRTAANLVRKLARPGDTLLIWGYRPELYVYTGLPAATIYLDSQPLTGVPADRHLTQSEPVETEEPRRRRLELAHARPTFIMDGLAPYNPNLAITGYPELSNWLADYREIARAGQTIIYRRQPLLALPAGGPLAEKRRDTFLRVGGEGIHRHHFLGVGVRLRLIEVDLRVERLFPDRDHQAAGFGDFCGHLSRGAFQFGGGRHLIHQTPIGGGAGVHEFPGEQHLERALAADGARERHHGSSAEEADPNAGRGEGSFLGSDRQVAGRGQLAPGGGSNSLYLGDHGLRNRLDLRHQFRADVENPAILIDVAARHFRQIVARAEHFARCPENHCADFGIGADAVQAGDQFAHHPE
jgi:hypothetical protein